MARPAAKDMAYIKKRREASSVQGGVLMGVKRQII